MDLESIGMEKGLLYETVVTTVNKDRTANAAPIGVICKDREEIVVYLHNDSRTVLNIKRNHRFIVNILKDPMVFVESTLGDLPNKYFEIFFIAFLCSSPPTLLTILEISFILCL